MALKDESLKFNVIVDGNDAQKALGDLGKQQRELREEEKLLRREKAKLLKTDKDYEKKLADLTDKIKRNKSAQAQNKEEQEKYRKELGVTGMTMNQLSKESKRLKSIMNSLTPGTEEWKKYANQLEEVDDRIAEVRGATKKSTQGFQQTGGALDELTGRFPVLNNFMTTYRTRAQGATGAGKKFRAGISALSKTIKTAGIIALIAALVAAARKFFLMKKEIDKNRRAVKQFHDVSGAALDETTAKVSGLANTYNKDFNEVLKAANTLSQEMGIGMNEALELMAKGFQTGADANGEFLEKLSEYPSQLKAAGYSAEETIAIMSQEVTSGVFSDKGIDAIKEATIRMREMTPATEKALQGIGISSKEMEKKLREGSISYSDAIKQVSEKLSQLPPQSREVGTAIADIFGGPGEDAGIKFLSTLKDMSFNLDDLVEKSNEFQKSQERLRLANEELNRTWQVMLGSSDGFFTNAEAGMKEMVNTFLQKGAKVLVAIANYFIDLYNNANGFRAVVIGIGKAFSALWDLMKGSLGTAGSMFKDFFQIISLAIQGNFEKAKQVADGFGKGVTDNLSKAWKEALSNFDNFREEIRNKDKIELLEIDFSSKHTEKVKKEVDKVKTAAKNASEETKKFVDEVVDQQEQLANELFTIREKYGLVSQSEYYRKELEAFKNSRAAKLLSEEEYFQALEAIEQKYKSKEVAMPEEQEFEESPELKQALLTSQYERRLYEQTIAFKREKLRELLAANEISQLEYHDKMQALDQQQFQQKMQVALSTFNQMGAMANAYSQLQLSQMEMQKQKEIEAAAGNEKKIAQIEKKYQKRKRKEQLKSAYVNMALAIGNALATVKPFIPAGLIAAGIAGVKGMAQVNMIKAQQARTGGMKVVGAEDGRTYDARFGKKPGKAGMIDGSNVLLTNEDGKPEYYVSNDLLRSSTRDPLGMTPMDHVNAIEYMSGRRVTPQKATGGFSQQPQGSVSAQLETGSFEGAISRFEKAISRIENGVPAYYGDDEVRNIRTRGSEFDKIEKMGK